ncbi:hypothetical protein JTE90_005308 [Oedothorax gibbosus]|uniref:Mutator-like transposase domain-containing protein n=1 Tax=Oedothorax gibbosus TaxID=931172 RepID=A0AAV6UHY0_9ARAC|nr:hypothetical protein JTE90_005308 [Oedothorax gibbosus]
MKELFSMAEIPTMPSKAFLKEQDKNAQAWEVSALQKMEVAVNEEKMKALELGEVDKNGIPFITVTADGSWSKRSYKTNYSSLSLSGCVSLISK